MIFGSLVVVITILIPLLINFLILRPAWFQYVGESTDWLAFWGCYLGGVFAAIVGFVTLYHSAKRQNLQLQISYQQMELRTLQAKLTDSVSIFDYSRICTINMHWNDASKYNDILDDLDEFHNILYARINSWGLMYANESVSIAKLKFQIQYEHCIGLFADRLTQMETSIAELRDVCYKHQQENNSISDVKLDGRTKNICQKIQCIIDQQEDMRAEFQKLFQLAQEWIQEEENEIDQLKQQLKL